MIQPDLFMSPQTPTPAEPAVHDEGASFSLDFLHPYSRYGAAVALHLENRRRAAADEPPLHPHDVRDAAHALTLVRAALTPTPGRFSMRTPDLPGDAGTTRLRFRYLDAETAAPGTGEGKEKQNAANGCYIAPHVLTDDKSARNAISELRSTLAALDRPTAGTQRADLKRSISPVSAKGNWGGANLTDPKASLLVAACAALSTVTEHKPAAWDGLNIALIPDLPLLNGDATPLLDFVSAFADLSAAYVSGAMEWTLSTQGDPAKRGYHRPKLHNGNYPEAASGLGALSVVAALGRVAREERLLANGNTDRAARARRVLAALAERPLYLVSAKTTQQQRFGHHLVALAEDHDLGRVLSDLRRMLPTGATGFKDPKVPLFRTMADRWIRAFTRPALRDFLAVRAEYPASLTSILLTYFQHPSMALSPEHVAAAREYGAHINYAAYRAAKDAEDDDRRAKRSGLSRAEYKQRFLVTLESFVRSAKSGPALLSSVSREIGRFSGRDLPVSAAPFMEGVAQGQIALHDAQDLMMAFMRLSTFVPKAGQDEASAEDLDSTADDEMPDEGSDSETDA